MLAGFDQDVLRASDAQSGTDRELIRLLKVLLIDRDGWVREICSTAYLIWKVVANDIETQPEEKLKKQERYATVQLVD